MNKQQRIEMKEVMTRLGSMEERSDILFLASLILKQDENISYLEDRVDDLEKRMGELERNEDLGY